MKNNKLYILLVLAFTAVFSACNFLEKDPDDRADIKTFDQVKKLMGSAYSTADYAFICEWSSDNIVDNNSEDGSWVRYNLSVNKGEVENEVFAWEPPVSAGSNDGDAPVSIWSRAYKAIAVANHALEIMDNLETDGVAGNFAEVRAEAYLCRAYNHFVLANIFCMPYRDSLRSLEDLGVPYMEVPEKVVYSSAERGNLTELYQKIEKDLQAGLKDITDNYDQPKYHFNKQAAYAFAARFYLYKRDYDKVIEYATLALGANPLSSMRTEFWSKAYSTKDALLYAYSNTQSPNNFLLTTTYSTFYRSLGGRYACNRQASMSSIYGTGPTWSNSNNSTRGKFHPCYMKINGLYLKGKQDYGLFFMHNGEYFEYSDKVSGIGYVHNVNATFTAEETLLCRAEAYIWKEDYAHALEDLKVWDESRKVGLSETLDELTADAIENFYKYTRSYQGTELTITTLLNCGVISPDWNYTSYKQFCWLNCVLHFRRIETIHDGLRWFDIKRYGIEVRHKQGLDPEKKLAPLDPRCAIQIPTTVIEAGIEPNPLSTPTAGNDVELFTGI